MRSARHRCPACDGEGYTANDSDRTPWSLWERLTTGMQTLGFRKMKCEACGGSGRQRASAFPSAGPDLPPAA